jgi:flagellar biogenesis protein FliO
MLAAALLLCLMLAGPALAVEATDGLVMGTDNGSLLAMIAKTVGALAVVVGLMLLLLFWIRKMGLVKTGRGAALVNILETRMIAPKKYVTVLDVAGERFVVGITEQRISFLTSLKNDNETEDPAHDKMEPPVAPFSALLKTASGRLTGKQGRRLEQDKP